MTNPAELSNMRCEKAAPGPKTYRIADRGGLRLLVTPAGGKLWQWRYHFDGKEKLMSLGKYPRVSLAQVRALHAQARAQLAAGVDPMAERKEAREEKKTVREKEERTAEFTFEKLVRLWYDEKWRKGKDLRYAANVLSRLEYDVIGLDDKAKDRDFAGNDEARREYEKLLHVGRINPSKITPADLIALTKATNSRGARDVAKRNLQFIRKIYKWGKSNNYLPVNMANPAIDIDLEDVLSNHKPTKHAHLKIYEVPELLNRMREYNGDALTRIAMELLCLTFVRTGEMIAAEWTEIDWENRRWNIPAEHMKMKLPHIVPLSTQTVALLKRLHTLSGTTGRLFPVAGGGLGTMSNNTVLKALERMGYHKRMTGHGWRHIASTYLNGKSWDERWVEAQMAHVKSGVSGVYNEAVYIDGRTAMMQAWADALDEMREQPPQEATTASWEPRQDAGKISLVRPAA